MNNATTKRRRAGRRDFGSVKIDGTPTEPRFSVRWYEGGRMRRKRGFRSRTDAAAFLARARAELDNGTREAGAPMASPDVTVKAAIEGYEEYRREKGNKAGSLSDTTRRLLVFFTEPDLLLAQLTPAKAASYYGALRTRITCTKRAYSVDSHRNMLAEAKSLLKWCAVVKRWIPRNPLEGVEGVGRRRHGKPQLRIDEARKWLAKARNLADAGDAGAIAAMTALLLGMRAGEIVSRVVRDLDDGATLLWIPISKTEAGKRTLRVPDMLRPHLQALATGKAPDALLFGEHYRDWVSENVRRICKAADVPTVCAHSMRGLHSTLAMEAGVTGAVVAASLGHENVSTTIQSYANPDAVAAARQHRALTVLDGGQTARKAS